LRDNDVRGVIHIAAKKQVGESVADPQLYYEQNVVGTLRLLDAAVAEKVPSFVFS
jgi:UDP-glucose 4-epimerase